MESEYRASKSSRCWPRQIKTIVGSTANYELLQARMAGDARHTSSLLPRWSCRWSGQPWLPSCGRAMTMVIALIAAAEAMLFSASGIKRNQARRQQVLMGNNLDSVCALPLVD